MNSLTENNKHRSKELLLTSVAITAVSIWGVSFLKGRILPQQPLQVSVPAQEVANNLEAYRIFQEQLTAKNDLLLNKYQSLHPFVEQKTKEKVIMFTSSQVLIYLGLGVAVGTIITFSYIAYQRSTERSKLDRRD